MMAGNGPTQKNLRKPRFFCVPKTMTTYFSQTLLTICNLSRRRLSSVVKNDTCSATENETRPRDIPWSCIGRATRTRELSTEAPERAAEPPFRAKGEWRKLWSPLVRFEGEQCRTGTFEGMPVLQKDYRISNITYRRPQQAIRYEITMLMTDALWK